MNKQIEEMTKVIESISCWQDGMFGYYKSKAEALYNAGYRKASDVAREIFAEIATAFIKYYDSTITYSSPTLPYHIREAVGFSLNEMFTNILELKKEMGGRGMKVIDTSKWIFKNCPFHILNECFQKLFPNVKYEAYFQPDLKDDESKEVYGLTTFTDDGAIEILIG